MLRVVFFVIGLMLASLGLGHDLTAQEKALWQAMRKEDSSDLHKILDNGYDLTKLTSTGGTALHWAAGAWPPLPETVIPLLLSRGAKIEQLDSEGRTPLIFAAQAFNVSATKLLIANKANIKAADKYGYCAIHQAVSWTQWDFIIGEREDNCAAIIRLLVEAGDDKNARATNGATPLILAAGHWHLPSVKILIELGADLDAEDQNGIHAISGPALWQPKGDILKALLAAGAKPDFRDYIALGDVKKALETMPERDVDFRRYPGKQTALMIAAMRGEVEIVQELLKRGASIDIPGYDQATVLHYATGTEPSMGQIGYDYAPAVKPKAAPEIIRLLVAKGAKLDAKSKGGETPLFWAINARSQEAAEELIRLGADPFIEGAYGQKALFLAIAENLPRVVEMILKRAASERRQPDLSSFDTAIKRHREAPKCLSIFLDAGYSPNLIYPEGGSPLITAAGESLESVKLLVAKGATVTTHDKLGHTAIMYAKSWDIFKYLLDRGAKPLEVAKDGRSALFEADAQTTAYLLKKGIKPNARIDQKEIWYRGYTPLMLAARSKDVKKAKLLLDYGADMAPKNNDGEDALDIAKEASPEVHKLLLEYKKKKGRSP